MAHIPINLGGGGGSGSDDCTAGKADVLKGKTAIFNGSDDEPEDGGMDDYSGIIKSATASLDTTNSRLQMAVPAVGKYNTASKLYATYAAIRSLIGLTADKLWYNTTVLGLKSTRAGQAAKTWTPGTSNQTIEAGTCCTGDQIIKGDANFIAANIKKGVKIFGITGTFEGYVPIASDLYLRGNNVAGFVVFTVGAASTDQIVFESGAIRMKRNFPFSSAAGHALITNAKHNLNGKTKIKILFSGQTMVGPVITAYGTDAKSYSAMGQDTKLGDSGSQLADSTKYTDKEITIPINSPSTKYIALKFSAFLGSDAGPDYPDAFIYRIRLE